MNPTPCGCSASAFTSIIPQLKHVLKSQLWSNKVRDLSFKHKPRRNQLACLHFYLICTVTADLQNDSLLTPSGDNRPMQLPLSAVTLSLSVSALVSDWFVLIKL